MGWEVGGEEMKEGGVLVMRRVCSVCCMWVWEREGGRVCDALWRGGGGSQWRGGGLTFTVERGRKLGKRIVMKWRARKRTMAKSYKRIGIIPHA